MKRAIGRGLLAVLVGELWLEISILILDGGIAAYVQEYSTINLPAIAYKFLIVAGFFLGGAINATLDVSFWWLIVGLMGVPFVDYVGLLFIGVLGVGGPPRQAWVVLVPALTTAAAVAPTLLVSSFQRQPAE